MPRDHSSLTTYDLLHTPGIYAALSLEDGDVVLVAVRLVGITTAKDGSTSPSFCDYHHEANEILFEPHELPEILRDMLWPREVPAEVIAPVEPRTDNDDPVTPGSVDYDRSYTLRYGPAF